MTKRHQATLLKWMPDAMNMGMSIYGGATLTPQQRERRRTIVEDALIAAVLGYDSSKGASFSTFLWRKIKWAILDAGKPRKSKVANARTFTDLMAEDV